MGSRSQTPLLLSLLIGCGALILLDKDDRSKFQTRCALVIFIHYAESHPIYTYAFYSPRTKRVLYRQDAIFLVNQHFPMRAARVATGLPASGEPLVSVRSPLGTPRPDDDLSFQHWVSGDELPDHADHVSNIPLTEPATTTRPDHIPSPPDGWPHRFPHHESFGPPSTVAVPDPPTLSHDIPVFDDGRPHVPLVTTDTPAPLLPTSFPTPDVAPLLAPSASDVDMTLATKDKDMTRGMGNLLKNPKGIVVLMYRINSRLL